MTRLLEKELIRHTLRQEGIEVTLWNYGGIIQDIRTIDRDGHLESVVLGLETVKDYQQHSPYFGAIVGRVAGRIGQARFEVAGDVYPLVANDGASHRSDGYIIPFALKKSKRRRRLSGNSHTRCVLSTKRYDIDT